MDDIDTETRWTDELRVLLERHPRAGWRSSGSPTAAFWLEQHDTFRRRCAELRAGAGEFRAGRKNPAELGTWLAPRLNGFVGHLLGHHQVEDFHYFPAFRAAERRLARGFDALARDHHRLRSGLDAIVAAATELMAALRNEGPSSGASCRHAGEIYVDSSERVYVELLRHLEDEEDLVIPVMVERGI